MSQSTLSPPFDSFRDALAASDLVTVDGVNDDAATLRLPADVFEFETVFSAARSANLYVTAITYSSNDSQVVVTANRSVTLDPTAPTPSDPDTLGEALDTLATHRGDSEDGNPVFSVIGDTTLQVHELFRIARDHGYRPVDGAIQTTPSYIEIELQPTG